MNNEQLIQDYIANRLSEKEKAYVERMLETDLDFKSDFETHKNISKAFKISEAKSLKERFQELEKKSPKQKSLFQRYKHLYLAVASVIIIGFFYNQFSTQTGDELFNSYFDIAPNTYQPITRTENSTNNDAFIAYENGNFLSAENKFETQLKTTDNPNIRFYYASSLLNQSKLDLALKQFQILNQLNFDYYDESLWYTALIYVKKEDFNNAKEYLSRLNNKKSEFKIEERKQLLEKVKN